MHLYIPRWSGLRAIGNSAPVRLTILIPLIGYLLIFNQHIIEYLEIISEIGGVSSASAHDLNISPRLLWIYYGFCALAVGSTIYSALCPSEIKYYGTPAGYVGGDGRNIGDFAFEPIEKILRKSAYCSDYERIRARYEPGVLTEQQKDQINNGILHLYFEYLNNSHAVMRLTTSVLFAFGFLCLSIPSLQIFYRVTAILFGVTKRFLAGG